MRWCVLLGSKTRIEGRGAAVRMKQVCGLKWQVALWINSLALLDSIIIIIQSQSQLTCNKIMLSDRSRSAGRLAFPQSREAFTRRLEELQEHNRQLLSKQSFRSIKRQTSTAPYPQSSQNSRLLRNSREIKRSFPELQQELLETRPLTTSTPRRHHKSVSPLSIIKRHQIAQEENRWQRTGSAKTMKSNFLRKGSSIDRAILSNVLRSKMNSNVCPSAFSYGDVPSNSHILRLVKQQIPRGMKDVVGAQEMMRMSHIMTGVRFKTLNLTHRVHSILHQQRHCSLPQEDDNLTLKSIQRWQVRAPDALMN